MEASLKHSIQGNHNLFSKVRWVTGNFSIIVAVLKIITPLISFLEKLPGCFIKDFFLSLLEKQSSWFKLRSMQGTLWKAIVFSTWWASIISCSKSIYLCFQECGTAGRNYLRRVLGQMDQRAFWHKKTAVKMNTRRSKLSMIVNGWPWEHQHSQSSSHLNVGSVAQRKFFSHFSSKTSFRGAWYMKFIIMYICIFQFFIYLDSPFSIKSWKS